MERESLSLSLLRSLFVICIFMHSDEPRGRNAGRPAPRRFSRPVYISSSTRTRHRVCVHVVHTHTAENVCAKHTRRDGGHSWPPPLWIRSRERRRYFSPRANRKNKECQTNAGDHAARYNRRCHKVFVLFDRIDFGDVMVYSAVLDQTELFLRLLFYKINSIHICKIRRECATCI